MKYRKKPVVIEAIEFKGYNVKEIKEFCRSAYQNEQAIHGIFIPTLEGVMIASIGDFIIKGVKGEFYPCKPDIFEATYETVEP